jgi:putative serine protease PepD
MGAMTNPLLWLDGDPTDGRRARVPEPSDEPTKTAPPPPTPPSAASSRPARPFRAALAGGLVSAVLVGGGALGLGLVHTGDTTTTPVSASLPAAPASTSVGAVKQGNVASIYAAASPGVVSVRTNSGSGTGFVVDANGTLVTNAHVVGDASRVQIQFSDDRTATATVRGVDRSSDLAVLNVDTSQTGRLHALEFADSSTVRTGQLAVAIGSPFALPQTATAGIVSGTGRHIQAPDGFQIDSVIQTDAPINPGNSGGPLLDANGRVIGVNSQIETGGSGNGNVGIGFAIPSNTVRDVIPRLERGETIQRAYLGVSTTDSSTPGAVVGSTTPGSPAAQAGIRAGDVIVAVGGTTVQTPDDVAAAIQDRRPGERVTVEVRRNGQTQTLDVTLAARPDQAP